MVHGAEVKKAVGSELAAILPDYGRPWWKVPHLLKLNFIIFSLTLFAGNGGYDNSMMNGLQALPVWQAFMNHPKGSYLGGINAIQAAGAFLSYCLMSPLANKYGRKPCVWLGLLLLTLGTALQTAAVNPAMFIAARFIVGSSVTFTAVSALLIAETAYPTYRAKQTSGYNTFYYVGSLVAAWSTFGTRNLDQWSWRAPSLLQIAIAVFALPGFIMAPESPRWLVSVGRIEEAKRVLVEHHSGGDYNSPLANFELREIEETLRLEREAAASTSYFDVFKTKGNRHRLLISVSLGVFAQWNGAGVVSYYLALVLSTVGITSVTQQTLISAFLQLWNLIIAVGAASLVDKLGRRVLFMISGIGMLVCYIIITGLSGTFAQTRHASTGLAVIPMLFLFFGFYDIAFTPLLLGYPIEIWPYQMRAKGVSITMGSTFLALFFNLFVNPIALANIGWKYYIVYVAILVGICTVIYFCYPETRGHTLEETARIFDGDSAAVPQEGAVRHAIDNSSDHKSVSLASEHVEVLSKA